MKEIIRESELRHKFIFHSVFFTLTFLIHFHALEHLPLQEQEVHWHCPLLQQQPWSQQVFSGQQSEKYIKF